MSGPTTSVKTAKMLASAVSATMARERAGEAGACQQAEDDPIREERQREDHKPNHRRSWCPIGIAVGCEEPVEDAAIAVIGSVGDAIKGHKQRHESGDEEQPIAPGLDLARVAHRVHLALP
jgi:hypothetical protein